jgi:oligoribonuclease NrnB/cAMP/cGMP phosphodiesterase (DHH superfamily)
MKTLVLYHAKCQDGFGAAYAAWRSLGDVADYTPVHYGDVVPVEKLIEQQVFILDFSFPPETLTEMAKHAERITLLDHHKTAAAAWIGKTPPDNVTVLFDMDRSGAQIAWDHFHPGEPRPGLIDHIGDRDLWRFKLPDTNPVVAGLGLLPMDFDVWKIAEANLSSLAEKGCTVLEILQGQIDSALAKELRTVTLGGYEGLATNAINNTSEIGNAIALKSGTFGMTFFIKGEMVICSVRSIAPFDVSAIATQYGGGGHAQAAGFQVPIARFFSEIWRSGMPAG